MENARERLMVLLTEMFQLDQADLDFGIYRVMNHKREEIAAFLRTELLPTIERAFQTNVFSDFGRTKEELQKAIDGAFLAGFDPNQSPKVQELKQRLKAQNDPKALEAEVCSDLVTFFARYYQGGDFVSRRRYKDDVYAIPYQGEEVKLHWANHDQYYIKSSERLSRYVFTLPDTGRRVRFEVVAGSTEKDNVKATQDKERRFVLAATPWQIDGADLVLRFEYRTMKAAATPDIASESDAESGDEPNGENGDAEGAPRKRKGPMQAQANEGTVKTLRAGAKSLGDWAAELLALAPTEKQPERTVVEKHLDRFTKRNDFDYFIHKDLRAFLRRELDVFIKNEVFHLDDVERQGFQRVEQALARIRVLREVAHKLIDFLAQLEEFQKTLWLKKKFVYDVSWCVTVDRVPEVLWPEVLANEAQRKEWVRLFAIDRIEKNLAQEGGNGALTMEFLKQNPSLVVDTALFAPEFTWRLLATIDDLDANTTGVLIHGENFQALNLMQARYGGKVKCVYIDPPYNTGNDGFAYKDGYQHSSWLAMMEDRLRLARTVLDERGVIFCSIDRAEMHRIKFLMDMLFDGQSLGDLVWKNATDNNPTQVAVEHEHVLCYAENLDFVPKVWKSQSSVAKELLHQRYVSLRAARLSNEQMQNNIREFLKDNADTMGELERYKFVDDGGVYAGSESVHNPHPGGYVYDVLHPETGRPMRAPANGYRFPEKTMRVEFVAKGRLIYGPDENRIVKIKVYLDEYEDTLRSVISLDGRLGAYALGELFGNAKIFRNPKPPQLVSRLVSFVATDPNDLLCDFFAGCGTTGHAAIRARRRFVLIESGTHFDTVLKPRILKVIHADEWKDGVPVTRKGPSAIVKVVRIESYEDALENLEPRRSPAQEDLLKKATPAFREKYFLQYMLDWETKGKGSLVDGSAFAHPFDRALRVTQGDDVRTVTVDLVETFNWLVGLTVTRMDRTGDVQTVAGVLPNGERALALWRDVAKVDIDALDAWWKKSPYNASTELDVVYVNGSAGIATHRPKEAHWRLERTETVFLKRMLEASGR